MKVSQSDEGAHYEIDNLDRKILGALLLDARTPFTEIAKNLIVSAGTIHVRMRKLEEQGIVQGSTLLVDPEKLGFDLMAFIGINLDKGTSYPDVIASLSKVPEVIEAHYTTGHFGIFAKVVCKNTRHMREVLNENIQAISGINSTETFISLEQSIRRSVQLVSEKY